MPRHHPKGSRLPALEQNILKYRALEMAIILFHVEHLKSFVLGSICGSDKICNSGNERIPTGTKKPYEKAWSILVDEGILTQDESAEVQRLIDYRNDIGHRIHLLVSDLSRDPAARNYSKWTGITYDDQALKKLKSYKEKIVVGLQSKYAVPLLPDEILFEAAEKSYNHELRRLDKKIMRQMAIRQKETKRLKSELTFEEPEFLNTFDPGNENTAPTQYLRVLDILNHPLNKAKNGTLTKRGLEICYWLFDHGRSALAAAFLMHVSNQTAVKHYRVWEKAKGSSK